MNSDQQALLLGLGAVLLWSTVATAFKVALGYLTPLELVWIAACVSWLLMTGLLWQQGTLREAATTRWRTALWAGLMNPVAYYLILLIAYDRLAGQEAMALNYTWALTMALLAVPILGHRLTRYDVLAGLIAYSGVLVIATRGDLLGMRFSDALGVGMALLSTLLWAFYWLMNTRDKRPALLAQWQNFSIAVPVLTLLVLLFSDWRNLPLAGISAGVYVGLFEMGLAFLLWQSAMNKTTRTARVSCLIFLAPPISLLILFLVLGETLLPSTPIGLALILAGLAFQQFQPVSSRAQRAS
ncbi:DMT family transporter [Halomonas salipaludis]|uniref:EamA family transporter n=1 Tax=Halomonas salipaludis TaxID=2032625 RepID=A0A2A2EVM4_9GAMM|nr:DMT family transporter [Halomonas salipaludis]PAU76718.1 EamA family transporter [Halomonas salipaludis]